MKLLLSFSTFIIVLFSIGCGCQDNFYGEPALSFYSNNDTTIELYHLDQDNRLIGKLDSFIHQADYAINLHQKSMKILLKYPSGTNDTLVLNYLTEVKFTNECNYHIEMGDITYTFTKNNIGMVKDISVSKNDIRHIDKVGYTVYFNR